MLQFGSGILRSCIIAQRNLLVSGVPDRPVLDWGKCLVDLTVTLAQPFDCALWAEESL